MLRTVDTCHRTGDLKLQLHRIATLFFTYMHSISYTAMCFTNICVCYGTMQRSLSQSCVKIQKNSVTKCCAVIFSAPNCVHTIARPWTRQVCKWFLIVLCVCWCCLSLWNLLWKWDIYISHFAEGCLQYHLYRALEYFQVLTLSLKLCASE